MWRRTVSMASLMLLACGQSGPEVAPVYPADPQSVYASKLAPCARESGSQRSCRLAELPLLGMQYERPGKAEVMARVATTHPWMAERFSQLLDQMPPEIYSLMRSVTAIIIGSDVRPSFYWRHTGAIYLDAASLWLSVDEKRSIDPSPDYRSGFADALQFDVISRYVQDNEYAWYSYSLEDDSERELADIVKPIARLLFHELAHAGDFFPSDWLASLDLRLSVAQAADQLEREQRQISQRLQAASPLLSELYQELAAVRFLGRTASEQQAALRAADAVDDFRSDGANDDYAYASRFEDVAMLAEESLMALYFAVQRDVAIADRPAEGQPRIVSWGQRGRIAADAVRPRAYQVLQGLLPGNTRVDTFFEQLPAAENLRSGRSWNDNLDPQGSAKAIPLLPGQDNPRDEVRD